MIPNWIHNFYFADNCQDMAARSDVGVVSTKGKWSKAGSVDEVY